ncbi:MAG: CYTH domain-containing protein [bacterium]|nr:CYTH domain-containing protein [bacterium]
MIEIEKKFQPTEEQLEALLTGTEFLGEKFYTDILYDFPDRRLFKKGFRLRNRNGGFELKIVKSDSGSGIAGSEEVENDPEILEKLGFEREDNLQKVVKDNMDILAIWETKRKKYKKGEFNIDVDETSFGYNVCEIEIMVDNPDQVVESENKILNLAQEFGLSLRKLPPKLQEYFRLMQPEVYKQLFN